MAADSEKAQVANMSEKASSAEFEHASTPIILDEETNKKLLRRIDWRVMPVVSTRIRTNPSFRDSN